MGVIGGGNFFELWVESSKSGTSLDFEVSELKNAGRPVFLNALGAFSGLGISTKARSNFPNFFRDLTLDDSFLCTLRNDGSRDTLKAEFGIDAELEIPDHGFFGSDLVTASPLKQEESDFIAVNLAVDMSDSRFATLNFSEFAKGLSSTLAELAEERSLQIRFIPHIYSDFKAISAVLDELPDEVRRNRTRICALDTSRTNSLETFRNYLGAKLAFTMRFHATVFALAKGIPIVALGNDKRVVSVTNASGRGDCVVRFDESFTKDLPDAARLAMQPETCGSYMEGLRRDRRNFEPKLINWLEQTGVISSDSKKDGQFHQSGGLK